MSRRGFQNPVRSSFLLQSLFPDRPSWLGRRSLARETVFLGLETDRLATQDSRSFGGAGYTPISGQHQVGQGPEGGSQEVEFLEEDRVWIV